MRPLLLILALGCSKGWNDTYGPPSDGGPYGTGALPYGSHFDANHDLILGYDSGTASADDGCCKHCGVTSKPCGDSCIANAYECDAGPGCACE